ncbi:MAG: GTP 3',8-cyclase MoaA [Myxococcota bacterium]|nr:GTP 3',8-cyclase MoaA [Myxococcota bacterium]
MSGFAPLQGVRPHGTLVDPWARQVRYLRISLTDRCNYRCQYCMPTADWVPSDRADLLTLEEIARVVRVLAGQGLTKVRLTGGEPLLRKDVCRLIKWIAETPGIETIAMTTNGHLLAREAERLFAAGLTRLNVSIDTFDSQRFTQLTGGGDLDRVLDGLCAATSAGFRHIRINAVLAERWILTEIPAFVTRCWSNGWTPRFIELMPIGDLAFQRDAPRISSDEVWTALSSEFNFLAEDSALDAVAGPARYRRVQTGPFAGHRVGTISPMSDHGFCGACNRVRLSARGGFRPCLANDQETSILSLMRNGSSDDGLLKAMRDALEQKLIEHRMTSGDFVPLSAMTGLGG